MDYAIVYSLLLLALVSLADPQVHYDPTWIVQPANIRELFSLENSHDRNVRDTGTSKSSSSNNGTFSIESGVGPGICLNVTREKETKYEVKRKSTLNYVYKAGCKNTRSMMDCFEPRLEYTNEIVPVEHFVRVRTPFCCEGYTQVASRNSTSEEESSYISRSWPDGDIYCKPVCNPPCINGHCAAPNTCKCPKQMVLMEDNRTCEVPECKPDCVNADCVGHNKCKCHRLYVKDPSEVNFCVPHCSVPCKNNSYCYMPNECRCMNGHRRNPISEKCEPICQLNCVNGYCSTAKECTCFEGFTKVVGSNNKCEPKCENCKNGVCTAPGVCKCNDLYKYNEKTKNCEAECPSDCTQGCDIPMQCKGCKEGYTRTEGSLDCRPQCKGCQNGVCSAPGVCKCNHLYEYNETTKNCTPKCLKGCTRGCDTPMTCKECGEGYKIKNGSLECEPECKGCNNGVCTAPDVCKCNNLYEYNETTENCTPKCIEGCTRGCDTPMTCKKCEEGYKIKNGSLECEPECKGCNNGVCTAPGVCKCNDLYKYNGTTNNCTPECPEDCSAGCDSPMQCNACGEGYKRIVGGPNCEPECKGCGNGECMAPGVCLCKEGYARDLDDTECVPKCDPVCRNGVCSAPKTCTCFKGYHMVNESVCESDTASCSKSVEDKIKLTHNDSCVDLHEPLQLYTDYCSSQFTNSSCSDELLCSTPETETHPICSMHYMCEFVEVPMLHSHSVQLQCRWRNRKMLDKNTTIEFDSSANSTTAVRGSNANMQDDYLPLHFFRSDFHLKPCLLCLCPVNETRSFCSNESYAFRLCACGSSEMAVIIEDSENGLFKQYIHISNYILYFICILMIVVVLFAVKIKCNNMKNEAKTYVVSSFSNDLYCDGISKFEETEHVYAEIEYDGYEQPKNIMLEFNNS
ncbi:multiple epidermal growth factor-like domains protein 11 [Nilaparvata lugens]|uniref:multiple epidermal growth factor-like domains protein 11 n=1 Tax=Nilaparvata lugens TaxID=108931 RepID=UPI00193CDB6A|nr:multiple epidermal growth factor-like domains protein 11 [Nilaparvata lugens]XP_039290369.1 multiple epidermal growth factor-like domains protein 11 [Nilaparvata lugens]XP_039290370.1 multiple epidermal growth factor-like domains protein 11 [Nilaparvata lugens]XP_039290371.1 multiple epidermal growth factor-like domains protein 11 [Nilaparvata lugens]XP_039290372.1 multiple epidermal growth factor-like domains protein 11 [Nilaparvata lugens]XP_039290373.1 multiple epidermal growth factor-li